MLKPKGFTTKIIHRPFSKDDANRALHHPIYSNSAFDFESAEQMEQVFKGQVAAHSYSRISNPTVENLELRIKEITQSLNVTALSSGMAAISNAIMVLASTGSNIVASPHLFGNTYTLLGNTLAEFGIETRFCNLNNDEDVRNSIDENTVAVFVETISNPQLEVVDLIRLSAIAHEKSVPLLADSTLTPPCIFDAKEFGVDIEIISSTKCISGGATSIGGLIIDYGTFDWNHSKKLKPLAQQLGNMAFQHKLRREIFRNFGACLSPFNAYLQSLGLETLQLRFEKAATNCLQLANFLNALPQVKEVNYPGLETNPHFELSKQQFGKYPGAILTFDLSSDTECFKFINKLKIIRRATNLYDNKTLIIHPASTIFCDLDNESRRKLNIRETSLRLSLGIEDPEDLMNDIMQAINS